jgi:DNA polymerase III psi subunit
VAPVRANWHRDLSVPSRTVADVTQPAAALGVWPRSSSAVLVAVGGPRERPRLLVRRHIDLVGEDLPEQAYHAAAGLNLAEAEALIERWARSAVDHAAGGIAGVRQAAIDADCRLDVVSIVAEARDLPALAVILRSHPLLHKAEGQLSRESIAEAAQAAGLAVHYVSPRSPQGPNIAERVAELGRAAGPPWRKEHKLAAGAALMALRA